MVESCLLGGKADNRGQAKGPTSVIYSQVAIEPIAEHSSLLIFNHHGVVFFWCATNASQMSRSDGSDACYEALGGVSFHLQVYLNVWASTCSLSGFLDMNSQYTFYFYAYGEMGRILNPLKLYARIEVVVFSHIPLLCLESRSSLLCMSHCLLSTHLFVHSFIQ